MRQAEVVACLWPCHETSTKHNTVPPQGKHLSPHKAMQGEGAHDHPFSGHMHEGPKPGLPVQLVLGKY